MYFRVFLPLKKANSMFSYLEMICRLVTLVILVGWTTCSGDWMIPIGYLAGTMFVLVTLKFLGRFDFYRKPKQTEESSTQAATADDPAPSSPELEILETAEERAARYRRSPLEEVSSPEFWMSQNHANYDSEPEELDDQNPESLPRFRERALRRFRAHLENAWVHSDQEAIWYWEAQIDNLSML